MQYFTNEDNGWALWHAFGATLADPLWKSFYRRLWWYCFWFTCEPVPYWGFAPWMPRNMPALPSKVPERRHYR